MLTFRALDSADAVYQRLGPPGSVALRAPRLRAAPLQADQGHSHATADAIPGRPDGAGRPHGAPDVYCDMTCDDGGWTPGGARSTAAPARTDRGRGRRGGWPGAAHDGEAVGRAHQPAARGQAASILGIEASDGKLDYFREDKAFSARPFESSMNLVYNTYGEATNRRRTVVAASTTAPTTRGPRRLDLPRLVHLRGQPGLQPQLPGRGSSGEVAGGAGIAYWAPGPSGLALATMPSPSDAEAQGLARRHQPRPRRRRPFACGPAIGPLGGLLPSSAVQARLMPALPPAPLAARIGALLHAVGTARLAACGLADLDGAARAAHLHAQLAPVPAPPSSPAPAQGPGRAHAQGHDVAPDGHGLAVDSIGAAGPRRRHDVEGPARRPRSGSTLHASPAPSPAPPLSRSPPHLRHRHRACDGPGPVT